MLSASLVYMCLCVHVSVYVCMHTSVPLHESFRGLLHTLSSHRKTNSAFITVMNMLWEANDIIFH